MLKRLTVAIAALFVLATPAFAAGTIPYSLSQQFDQYGHVLAGCKLNIIQAGTVGTPQTAYQDSALTIPVSGGSQLICDAAGRLPQFFLADGSVKILLADANGVTQVSADGILVVGASSGGGGGSPVDATTILATGDMKITYGTGVLSGFVRANGRTIGSSTSGASERANADTQALFLYLWGADATLAVSTGRGVSAAADWAANKTITLPDMRSRSIMALSDMGNTTETSLASVTFSKGDATTLGSVLGAPRKTLVTANLPPYTPAGTNGSVTVTSGLNIPATSGSISPTSFGSGSFQFSPLSASTWTSITSMSGSGGAFTGTAQGGTSTAFDTVSPSVLLTIYLKL